MQTPSSSLEPATPDAIARSDNHANTIAVSFLGEIDAFGFNAASVRFMAGVINDHRTTYTPEATARIAELYGAFLCKALLAELPEVEHVWVTAEDGETGVLLSNASTTQAVLPAAAIRRHIDEGPGASSYDYFMAIHELFRSNAL